VTKIHKQNNLRKKTFILAHGRVEQLTSWPEKEREREREREERETCPHKLCPSSLFYSIWTLSL
jgi:hypothetical protein